MTLEIILSVCALLFGFLIYWRESRSNAIFRAFNSFINKKETRMAADDFKGFFYLRKLPFRALNALVMTALFGLILYYIPFLNLGLQPLATFFVGFVLGTYIAGVLPSVKRAMDNPLEAIKEVGDKGRNIVEDLTESAVGEQEAEIEERPKESPKEKKAEEAPPGETARERMKRKGYLK